MAVPDSYRRAKGLRISFMAGLAFAGVGLAAPAQADANQDQSFYRLLTDADQDHPMVIWNFGLVRSLGIATCQREDAGETPYQAVNDLVHPNGPYTFDYANSVASSASTIYCNWHDAGLTSPNWASAPTPVYPPPMYPPQAWNPESPPPFHLPSGYNDGD
jgi:hypothetical protein